MKSYAIITDIHGNRPALEAVFQDLHHRKIDRIFCLGDMVGIGPDSNEVIQLLLEQENISYVIGNHDLAVVSAYNNEEPPKGHHNERVYHKWLADRIDPNYINFMSKLPKQIIYEDSSCRHFFAHYHLDMTENYLPIEQNPTIDKLEDLYQNSDFDSVCFGHHHMVHQFKSDKTVYFNPGSLGCFHKPIARYGILRIHQSHVESEVIEIPYNNKDFLRSYEELKVPDREFILKIFHGVENS